MNAYRSCENPQMELCVSQLMVGSTYTPRLEPDADVQLHVFMCVEG